MRAPFQLVWWGWDNPSLWSFGVDGAWPKSRPVYAYGVRIGPLEVRRWA